MQNVRRAEQRSLDPAFNDAGAAERAESRADPRDPGLHRENERGSAAHRAADRFAERQHQARHGQTVHYSKRATSTRSRADRTDLALCGM